MKAQSYLVPAGPRVDLTKPDGRQTGTQTFTHRNKGKRYPPGTSRRTPKHRAG